LSEEIAGDLSSTEVRNRLNAARAKAAETNTAIKINIHGLITPNVISYVLNNELYKK
jgi:hypothetical protein